MKKLNHTKPLITLIGACVAWTSTQAAAPSVAQGRITVREYYFDGANAISRLTDHAGYPNSPNAVYYPMHFEWPTGPTGRDEDSTDAPPSDVANNYAWEIRGYYHPDRTGEHFFAVASGDPSELWLSTDDSFDNLELIADEPTRNPVRAFGTEERRAYVDVGANDERLQNWSKGIQLQIGQAYAIMARSVEGGGSDNLAVAHSNELWFEDGMEPIPGSFLSTFDRDSLSGTFLKGVTGDADSVTVTLKDGEGFSATTVDVNSITVKLDGKLVEVTVSQSAGINTATHEITSGFLASGSEHEVEVVWEDSAGNEMAAASTFSVVGYATVASSLAISNVDSSKKGFLFRTVQSAEVLGNDSALREQHLAGEVGGENIADDWGSDDYVWTVDLINFDQDGNAQGEFRDLGDGSSQDVFDDFIPGIPRPEGGTDNITGEIHTVVRVPKAGLYTFGFNSDDGFKTIAGNDAADSVYLGGFNGGRGASTTSFRVLFPKAGDYPLRSIWYQGGGDANLEWFTITPNKALLNDTGNGGLATFAVKPELATSVTSVSPASGGVAFPNENILLTIADGNASVDTGSVQITLGGQAVEASVRKSGGVTTVEVDRGGAMWSSGEEVTVGLSYSAGGSARDASWSFNARTYVGIASDSVSGHNGLVLGDAKWTEDGGGASGQAGDLGLDLTGTSGTMIVVGADFLNDAFAKDVLTVAFWAKKSVIGNSSSVWITSESAGAGNRGFQAHTPWSNNNVYFDTQGCCAADTQRVNGDVAGYEFYEDTFWDEWHLWSFSKDMDLKEVRIDGNLFLESFGADPLSADVMDIWVGSERGGANYDRSLFDDFAIYDRALSESDLKKIASGTSAGSLDGLIAFWDFNTAPAAGGDGAISSVALADGSVVIEYTGTLKSATSVTGPYSAVAGASSPYSVAPTKAAEFYIAE